MNIFDKLAPFWDLPPLSWYFKFLYHLSIKTLKQYLNDGVKILDIGCSTGNFLGFLSKKYSNLELYGVDISKRMIDIAKRKFPNINFTTADVHHLKFDKNYFDIIVMIESFHHFKNQNEVIEKVSYILKPNGVLLIIEPDIESKLINVVINLLKKFSIEKESEFHKKDELENILKRYKFSLEKFNKLYGNSIFLFRKAKG